MDEDSREVWRAGHLIHLTATEFNVLRMFMLNPRRVLSKGQIIDNVWHYDFDGNQNIIETYVRYCDASSTIRAAVDSNRSTRRLRAARGVVRNLSLRTRLLIAVGAITLFALVAADVTIYASLNSYLYRQVDSTLQLSHMTVEAAADGDSDDIPTPGTGAARNIGVLRGGKRERARDVHRSSKCGQQDGEGESLSRI